jgi:hypothetical protein
LPRCASAIGRVPKALSLGKARGGGFVGMRPIVHTDRQQLVRIGNRCLEREGGRCGRFEGADGLRASHFN